MAGFIKRKTLVFYVCFGRDGKAKCRPFMFVLAKASSWRTNLREVVVLSKSTTAIGMRVGSPLSIIHINNTRESRGATNIPQIQIFEEEISLHSLLNIANMPVSELI